MSKVVGVARKKRYAVDDVLVLFRCPANNCAVEAYERDPLYICFECGNEFYRSESNDNDHRCDCGRFASISWDEPHWKCPECGERVEPGVKISVIPNGKGDYLEVKL